MRTTTVTAVSTATVTTIGTSNTGREPVRVIYEEFVGARAATLGRVLDGLQIPPREWGTAGRGPMRRQADDVSQGWVDRFRQEDMDRTG